MDVVSGWLAGWPAKWVIECNVRLEQRVTSLSLTQLDGVGGGGWSTLLTNETAKQLRHKQHKQPSPMSSLKFETLLETIEIVTEIDEFLYPISKCADTLD